MANSDDLAQSIFLNALEIGGFAERSAYVDNACADNAILRREVAELLDHERRLGRFLDDAPGGVATIDMPPFAEKPGTQIGPYKLREQIGEGGFGVVYVAQQSKPVRRKVALKIIKPGMDTKDVITRFEAERQALALMDHANIAKVLDAGATDSGRPYFVMELVRGVPITEFCDEQKLSTRERLQLFVDICRAIQHAHQKGVIHRDLKPSNIMVTLDDNRPIPKVIDFGISKALSQQLTDNSVYTAYGQMIGTPLYMAPEQAQMSMRDVDTRSDVYSLGVLLYELLTGTTPFDKETLQKSGLEEMRRIICEVEPPRPSARISTLKAEAISTVSDKRKIDSRKLSQSLRGELDWIVMKALEKDRNRRYESASAFAADVERYLNDAAVQARPASLGYLLRKFVRKNRTAAAMIVMAGLLIAALTVSGFVVAKQTQDKADRDRQLAQKEIEINQKLSAAVAALQTAKDHAAESDFEDDKAWSAARQTAERAKTLAENELASRALKQKMQAALADLRYIEKDRILFTELRRLRDKVGGEVAQGDTLLIPRQGTSATLDDPGYYKALVDYGLIVPGKTSAEILANRIKARPTVIRKAIIAGLDQWREYFRYNSRLLNEKQTQRYHVVSHALTLVDDDPWRNKVRNTVKRSELGTLARDPRFDRQRPHMQLLLAMRIIGGRVTPDGDLEHGISLLRRAQRQHPQDYWLNDALADVLLNSNSRLQSAAREVYRGSNPDRVIVRRLLKKRIKPQSNEAVRFASIAAALRPNDAKALSRLAQALKAAGKPIDAEVILRRVIRLNRNDKAAYLRLGSWLEQRGKADAAVKLYKSALVAVPARTGDADIILRIVPLLQKLGRSDQLILLLKSKLSKRPDDFNLYGILATAFFRQEKWEDAANAYRRQKELLAKNPGWEMHWYSHVYFAEALLRAGRKAEAINAVRDMVRFAYRNGLFYVSDRVRRNLAESPRKTTTNAFGSEPDEKNFNRILLLLNLLPKDAAAKNVLGTFLFQNEKKHEALAVFLEATDLDPDCFLARYNVACTLTALNRHREAVRHFEQALRRRANTPAAWYDLGLTLRRLGRHGPAVQALRQAIHFGVMEVPPNYQLHLARSLRETGRIQEAVAACYEYIRVCDGTSNRFVVRTSDRYFVKVLRQAPGRAKGYAELRKVFAGPNAASRAEKAIRNLIKSRPSDAEAYYALGNVLSEQKRRKAAIESFRTATRLDPGNPRYFNKLGMTLGRVKRWREAETAFRRNIELAPEYGAGPYNLALVLYYRGKPRSALKVLDEHDVSGALVRGHAHRRLHEYDEAIKWYRQVTNPKRTASAKKALANALTNKALEIATSKERTEKSLDEAEALVRESIKIVRDRTTLRRGGFNRATLALIQFRGGDHKAARESLQKALGFNPDQVVALLTSALISLEADDVAGARKALRRASSVISKRKSVIPSITRLRDEVAEGIKRKTTK